MVVLDIETTGLSPERCSIASIGAVDFKNPERQFYQECRIFDDAQVTAQALKINGFTIEELRDIKKQPLDKLINNFRYWISLCNDQTLAGENLTFDRNFLQAAIDRLGIDWYLGHRSVDLHSLCYSHMLSRGNKPPVKKYRTDLDTNKILRYTGLPTEPEPHIAINGALYEAEAFSRLIYGKNLFKRFADFKIPYYPKNRNSNFTENLPFF